MQTSKWKYQKPLLVALTAEKSLRGASAGKGGGGSQRILLSRIKPIKPKSVRKGAMPFLFVAEFGIKSKMLLNYHSVRKLFIGVLIAALIAWKHIVNIATPMIPMQDIPKTHHSIFILYA